MAADDEKMGRIKKINDRIIEEVNVFHCTNPDVIAALIEEREKMKESLTDPENKQKVGNLEFMQNKLGDMNDTDKRNMTALITSQIIANEYKKNIAEPGSENRIHLQNIINQLNEMNHYINEHKGLEQQLEELQSTEHPSIDRNLLNEAAANGAFMFGPVQKKSTQESAVNESPLLINPYTTTSNSWESVTNAANSVMKSAESLIDWIAKSPLVQAIKDIGSSMVTKMKELKSALTDIKEHNQKPESEQQAPEKDQINTPKM